MSSQALSHRAGPPANAGNYTLAQPVLTGAFTAKDLTVTGITADNKAYDGNADATLTTTSAELVGAMTGDAVTLESAGATGAFDDANVGTGKTVQVSGLIIGGADAAKYTLTQPTANADITAKDLTVISAAVTPKVYDGTTAAAITGATLSGVVDTEVVTLANDTTGTFNDKNIGSGKAVGTAMTLAGADADNYALTQPTLTGEITAKDLTVISAAVTPKVYDGTTAAAITGATLIGAVDGDVVSPANDLAGAFNNKDIGNNKPVISAMTLAGTDAGNYTLAQPTLSGDITAKGLTVTGITADNKPYDGNTTATLNTAAAALEGAVPADAVTLDTAAATAAFADPNVGTAKTVAFSGLTLSGGDAGNYTLAQPSLTADITAAESATVLVSSANPSQPGSNVTFTATVSSTAGTPAGDVVFKANDVPFSTSPLVDGVAVASNSALPLGTNTITAEYAAQGNYAASSDSLDQVVSVVETPTTAAILNNGDGSVTVLFLGTPGAQYIVQARNDLNPATPWVNVSTNTAGTDGTWTFEDTTGLPQRFYRSAKP